MFQKKNVWLLVIVGSAAAGIIPAFAKLALTGTNPGSLTVLRYAYTFAALVAVAMIAKRKIEWKKVRGVLPISLFSAVNAICFAIGIQYTPASSVQLLYVWLPILIAILSWFLLKQHITARQIIGMAVGLIGIVLVVVGPLLQQGTEIAFEPFGAIVILFGGLSFSFYSVLSKSVAHRVTPEDILLSTAIATIALQVVYMLVVREPFILPANPTSLVGTLMVGLIGTAFNYWLFQYIVKVASPLTASMGQYITPVFGAFFAFFLLGDTISSFAIIGGAIAIAGAIEVSVGWKKLLKTSK